jgi:hypothetical protein
VRQPRIVEFMSGLRLASTFYDSAVRPLVDQHFPGLPHTAALLGTGSEVLGFDSPRSTDHDWGPRLQLFLDAPDQGRADRITAMFAEHLPATWQGYPTAFERSHQPIVGVVQHIEVTDLGSWLRGRLGFDPRAGITVTDWLAAPTQRIAEVTGGIVCHDGLGELEPVRSALAWYPDDVWRYVLACQWRRIGQEEAFPGRCTEVGDELGAAVVTARLVRDLMRLCLLLRRRYPPYSKWLGTAFARLPDLGELPAYLAGALSVPDWPTREDNLVAAYEAVAVLHNESGLTEPVDPTVRPFHTRPFRVLAADRFTHALLATIEAPETRHLSLAGAVDQFVDNTDALGDLGFTRAAVLGTQPV